MKIDDGSGKGFQAKVTATNRLETRAISESEGVYATTKGDAFNINTGLISFTGNGTLVYFKNDEDFDVLIEAIALGNNGAGTHTTRPYITLVRNPTGGDLITDATDVDMKENRNFGSNKSLKSTTLAYKGKQGGTLTGGDDAAILQSSSVGRDFYPINLILTKGSSLGIEVVNSLGSGTAVIYAALIVHAIEED